jgi:hypothetical protein
MALTAMVRLSLVPSHTRDSSDSEDEIIVPAVHPLAHGIRIILQPIPGWYQENTVLLLCMMNLHGSHSSLPPQMGVSWVYGEHFLWAQFALPLSLPRSFVISSREIHGGYADDVLLA